MPSTSELTDEVLRTEKYVRHTDGTFVPANPPDLVFAPDSLQEMMAIQHLLQGLRSAIQDYFNTEKVKERNVNYEDLYYAADQIADHLDQNFENPFFELAVKSFEKSQNADRLRLKSAADLTRSYIHDVVARQLSKIPGSLSHLGCLLNALNDQRFIGVDVFTLNHDRLIEETLRREGIAFVDGFATRKGIDSWSRELFKHPSRHYFLKLHGSLDWFDSGPRRSRSVVRLERADRCDGRCKLLIGTFNKMRDYSARPWFDLLYVFRRQLGRIQKVFVSGYSFGDKGVNTCLAEWLDGSQHRRLICLHKQGNACFESARGAIRDRWQQDRWHQMHSRPQYLADSDWATLSGI
jgi:hypothetical protein